MLTVGWYINESKNNPNVRCTDNYDFVASRDIKKGKNCSAIIQLTARSEITK